MLRIESQQIELSHEEFSPAELVSDLIDGQMPMATEKGLKLLYRCTDDVPEKIVGDPQRVGQVLLNLVTNAIKFTDKGSVTVDIRTVGRLMWSVAVTDTGRGISEKDQKIIFERFRQVDGSASRAHDGVGLGLAIAQDLVHLMGGALRVTSEGVQGKGSTFTMTLPIVKPGEEPAKPAKAEDDTISVTVKGNRTAPPE